VKHVSNLIDLSKIKQQREQEKEESLSPETAEVINWLFRELRSNFTAFKQAWPDKESYTQAKKTWLKAFVLAGINRIEQIKHGLNRCYLLANPFVPTPGQFISWCTPSTEELGIPSVEDAYGEACINSKAYNTEKKWSHQAVYHAYTMCNSYDLANLPRTNTFPIFERNYDITVKMMLQGEPLKDIPVAITHDEESESNKIIAKGFEHCHNLRAAMDAIREMLGVKEHGSSEQGRMQKDSEQARI